MFLVKNAKSSISLSLNVKARSRWTQLVTVSLNPTHDSCQQIDPTQPNPWMDQIRVYL